MCVRCDLRLRYQRSCPLVFVGTRRRDNELMPMTPKRLSSREGYDSACVDGYSRQEVAGRAGVNLGYVDRLVELGILKPGTEDAFSQGDVRRARWVHSLEAAGVPLDGMAAAVHDGTISFSFLDASAFDRFAELSGTTFQELSDRTGIPMDLLKVVREAVGFAEPQPEDHVREDELAVVPVIELQLSTGLRPIMIGRWLRVCADSLRRITETETDWYRTARGFAGGIGRRANYARARSTSPLRRQPDVAPFSPPRAARPVMKTHPRVPQGCGMTMSRSLATHTDSGARQAAGGGCGPSTSTSGGVG